MLKYINYIIATILKWLLARLLFAVNYPISVIKGESPEYLYKLAYMDDVKGGHQGKYVWNWLFLEPFSLRRFGDRDEAMSAILAYNYYYQNTKWIGTHFSLFLILCNDKAFLIEDTSKRFWYKFKNASMCLQLKTLYHCIE